MPHRLMLIVVVRDEWRFKSNRNTRLKSGAVCLAALADSEGTLAGFLRLNCTLSSLLFSLTKHSTYQSTTVTTPNLPMAIL